MPHIKSSADYEPAIVTFIDILGFREQVVHEQPGAIAKKLDLLTELNKGNTGEDLDAKVFQFSDSIVRVRRINTEANQTSPLGLVFWELLDLVHIQTQLTRSGVFLRGGITFGDICISSDRIFGPALVQAYDLESKLSIYPRIVVDPKLLRELKKNDLLRSHGNTAIQEKTYIKDLITQADDGIWFIDYARACREEFDDPNFGYSEFLVNHKEEIVKNAKNFATLNSASGKYLWLASYHNKIVAHLTKEWLEYCGIARKDIKIDSSEMATIQIL